ncbi:MAG: LacI family transcriptional regulator [Treponema sp.]|jgi:DNA-binding LacI/PurR family transcriptional regulator|nr:LacI family transcriptional regulator [Treponema sp.]
MKKITDVARAANVSIATVSKVFNGYSDIAEDTKEKILRIAKEMDYFPNHYASRLVKGKDEGICVVLSNFGGSSAKDEYLVGLLSGIHSEAEKYRLRVIISTEEAILQDNRNYVQFCRSNKFMGFIIHGLGMSSPGIAHLLESEVSCVFVDIKASGEKKAFVTTDNVSACTDMVDVLFGLGHREIAFIAGSGDAWVTLERIKGYEAAMNKHQLSSHVMYTDFRYAMGYEKAREHVLKHPETTALFCASDVLAAAAIDACIDLGYDVPREISVTGYDDLSFASYLRPKLTTIAQDFYGMGVNALATIIQMYQNFTIDPVIYVPYEIKIRQSAVRNSR